MDGVNSMTGNPPRLAAFLALARANDALLYVDAHGFGVIGERDRSETSRYGRRGNGVVRHLGESDDHLEKLGAYTLNRFGFPIVEVPLADPDDLARAGRFLLDRGVYVTLAFYPGVPREEVGFRSR
jgi:7-keto-8-aminopelargonate synthetase-like enzyme